MNDADKSIQKLIKYLKGKECLFSVNKQKSLDSARKLRLHASEIGLSPEQILSVAEVAAAQKFGDIICNHLIHALLPREAVPEDAALLIISKICHDVQSLKTKSLLIRWLVLVFDLITTKSKLHCLYGIVFHYIQSDLLCPSICHLLVLLTRKNDVTHYRISKLLEIQRKVGSSPHISGLLSVYRMYCPSLITMSGGYKTFFKKTDKAWEQSIQLVQRKYGLHLLNEAVTHSAFENLLPKTKKQMPLISEPKVSMVHDARSLNQLPLANILSNKVPVYQIKSFQELLENFSQLDLSCQAFTLLHTLTLQHIVAVTPDRTVPIRLSFWLHHHLNEELVWASGETERGKEVLKIVLKFCDLAQECLPVCESFLLRYIFTWNGQDYRSLILKLITKLRILSYKDFQNFILRPLAKLYHFSSSVYFKCSIINALSELLSNYLTLEAPRLDLLIGSEGSSTDQRRCTIYPSQVEAADIPLVVSQLVQFVDAMYAENASFGDSELLPLHYMLQFHKKVSRIYKEYDRPLMILPSHQIVVEALFSLSSPFIASLCNIFLEHLETAEILNEKSLVEETSLNTLNQYMVDIFDTLWRRQAFAPFCSKNTLLFRDIDSSSLIQLLSHPEDLPPYRMFCLDRHPALLSYSSLYLNKNLTLAAEAEFVSEDSFMEFLQDHGLNDIVDLIKKLRNK